MSKRLPGLDESATIYRDEWGIAHVRARRRRDAFFAQGYVHAEDRFWQMDAARRRVEGRWAEWIGAAGVESDALARRLGAAEACRRDYEAIDDEAREIIDAYAAGVNAWLGTGDPLPSAEYAFLTGAPEPWAPWHCIAAMRWRGWLMGSLWFKLWRAAALAVLPAEQVAKLRIDDGGIDRLCIPPGVDAKRWVASLAELAPAIAALEAIASPDMTGGGSNNWAIAGSRTASGRPLLAGDPHRVFEMPGMYAQGHVGCEEFDAVGLEIPGVPGFPHFAHNGHVAWGVTHAFADIHDLFVERFEQRDGGWHYLFEDRWLPVRSRRETIRVRDGEDRVIDIHETHHGPVIAGDPRRGSVLALRSMQFAETDRSFECLLRMLCARNTDDFFEATRGWGLIDHNVVAADTAGHIAHRVRAIVPIRPRSNGWLPVPGWTGEHEWRGMVPFEDMPHAADPERGFIVTANNRFVADDGPHYLCTDCHPPYRARRLEELIAGLPAATVDDMAALHRDVRCPNAELFRALVARAEGLGEAALALRERILDWDGELAADSVGATAYEMLRWTLTGQVARRSGLAKLSDHELLRLPPGVPPTMQLWWVLPSLIREDDTGLLDGQGWPTAVAAALEEAGARFDGRPWGEHHRARLVHPLQSLSAAASEQLAGPALPLPGDNETVMATGCAPASGLAAPSGSVARYAFDIGNWDESRWIVLDGASGEAGSPNRFDQNPLWARGEMVPMRYSWKAIARNARSTVTLRP